MNPDFAIAVVGMAARVPGAADLEEFWDNLVRGRESLVFLDDEALRRAGAAPERFADPAYVRAVAMVDDIDKFDAPLFRVSTREAQLMDPQIRMFLEVAHSALENAGYDVERMNGRVGVFASGGSSEYLEHHLHTRRDIVEHAESSINALNRNDYVATTVSYKLNLHGPSMTVQTACSSTLVALHLACRSLQTGECDIAIVGGADMDLAINRGYRWLPGGVLSRDGHVRTFDAEATGTRFSGGSAAVVLRRLSDAQHDDSRITAIVRATAVNNDGSDKVSFGAPSIAGQREAVTEAMRLAEIKPADVSYVEAHGTGTVIGDPIELTALNEAYCLLSDGPLEPESCAIGSVKSNLGHLGSVAGIIGFVKTALALERGQLPPTVNFTRPNPNLHLERTPFRVNDRLTAWPRQSGRPRHAGLSALGVGGSNAHVILCEPPVKPHAAHDGGPRLLVWSALDADAAAQARQRIAGFLAERGDEVFADAVATLAHGRTRHPVRGAVVCTGADDAASALRPGSPRVLGGEPVANPNRPVALLFPGQGSQAVAMAAGLHRRVPAFAAAYDRCLDLFAEAGLDLRPCWRGEPGAPSVDDTLYAQPLLFSVDYALAEMWSAAGVTATALLGHSVGELVAATVAGVWTLPDAVAVTIARARAIEAAEPGGLLAVAGDASVVADLLKPPLALAAVNSDRQVMLSGPDAELTAAAAVLQQRGVATRRTAATRPFHNPALAACVDAVAAVLDGVELRPPTVALYSTATGRRLTAAEAADPKFWADQIVQPVRYADAAAALLENDHLLVEAGPGTVLGALVRRHPAVRSGQSAVIASLPAAVSTEDADLTALWQAAGRLWTEGYDPVWTALGLAEPTVRVDLPHYPYQRKRYWIDPAEPTAAPVGKASDGDGRNADGQATNPTDAAEASALPAEADVSPFSLVTWAAAAGAPLAADRAAAPGRARTALVLLPDDPAAALTVVRALQLAGLKTIRVRRGSAFSAGEEFTVRWGAAEDVARLVHELVDRGTAVDALVHAATAREAGPCDSAGVDAALDAAFHSLLDLVRHGSHAGGGGRLPELIVLTSGAVDVSGAENTDPAKAMLLGAVRTLAKETPWQTCRLVDFAAATSAEDLSDELARPADGDPVVALRGHRRWVPRETPFDPAIKTGEPIRQNGVYLITGGLGGIGLSTARALAETGRCPNLVLVGRHVPAAEPDPSDTASRELSATLASLEGLGAKVRAVACDVADARGLRRALDLAGALFGRVDGVFHFAGVAGDGMLAVRDREAAAEVLRPKVRGTLLLAEALRGGAVPDFLVLSSSRAAYEGLVGSGDYAAANAFLDAAAAGSAAALPGRTLSIGFPSWREVGMAARPSGATAAGRPPAEPESVAPDEDALVWTTVLSAETAWVLDEHRLDGVPVLPGTGYLDLVVRAFRESMPATDGQPALVLSNVVFAVPLRAPTPHEVRVEFTAADDGHAFAVISRAHGESVWVRHVTGRIGWSAETPGDPADLPAIRARIPRRALPDLDDPNRMFTLGSRWRCCTTLHSGGDERLVELDLPEPLLGDLAEHPLHPAILDCSTAALRDPEETPHVPFLYPRIVVFGELPGRATAHVRRTWTRAGVLTGDVDVYDAEGRPVVAVTGFTMRNVDTAFQPAPAGRSGRSSAAPGALAPGQGIAPETGCALILRLLAARVHGHVLVRPYQDGRPVAAAEVRGAVAAPPAPASPAVAPAATSPASPAGPAPAEASARATGDEFLARLHGLWAESLGIDTLGPDDDFFDMGGNSLSAVELLSRIRSEFGVELNVGLLYDAPTPRQLAESVARSAR